MDAHRSLACSQPSRSHLRGLIAKICLRKLPALVAYALSDCRRKTPWAGFASTSQNTAKPTWLLLGFTPQSSGRYRRHQVVRLRTEDLQAVTDIYNTACRARESTQGIRPWSVDKMKPFLFETRPSFESYSCLINGAVTRWTAFTRYSLNEDVKHTAEMSLYVQEPFRRMGVGTALANTLLNRARILDLHCIFAIVFKEPSYVASFAERKCGFSVVGSFPEVFSNEGKHYDLLVLEKLITS